MAGGKKHRHNHNNNNDIPLEIQVEIIKRVSGVKSLIRFRSVSKRWKAVIDSREFIADHSRLVDQTQPPRLLVPYYETGYEFSYVSIVDDDSFPHHKFSPAVTPTVWPLWLPTLLGCAHGLVCFLNNCQRLIVVWNPAIRKSVGITLPSSHVHTLGFGVCRKTFDPKIIKIVPAREAAVLTLTSHGSHGWTWRSVSMNPYLRSLRFSVSAVDMDGVIYWVALDPVTKRYRIIPFDLATEEFGQAVADLPDSLVGRRCLDIFNFKESLAVLDYHGGACDVWMMLKNTASFTKVLTLKAVRPRSIVGFRKNGQPMHAVPDELRVYEAGLERMNGVGILGFSFNMASYTESLLLLNHSD